MKKLIIILIALAVSSLLVIKLGVFFVSNCDGDICGGPDKLEYVFAKNKIICSMVKGNYNEGSSAWGNKKSKNCNVNSKWLCGLRGGELKDFSQDGYLALPGATYYCGKE